MYYFFQFNQHNYSFRVLHLSQYDMLLFIFNSLLHSFEQETWFLLRYQLLQLTLRLFLKADSNYLYSLTFSLIDYCSKRSYLDSFSYFAFSLVTISCNRKKKKTEIFLIRYSEICTRSNSPKKTSLS